MAFIISISYLLINHMNYLTFIISIYEFSILFRFIFFAAIFFYF